MSQLDTHGKAPAAQDARKPAVLPPPCSRGREELRGDLRRRRAAQRPAQAVWRGLAAQRLLLAAPLWERARSVALYVGVGDELPTGLLLRAAWGAGMGVWLPRLCRGRRGVMEFAPCPGPGHLRPGPLGLLEPREGLRGLGAGDPAFAPDLMVVPGLAFDRAGGRLGYGGGYYDRFLAACPAWPRVGLCYDFQLVRALPLAPWDQPVSHLCTEERLLCL